MRLVTRIHYILFIQVLFLLSGGALNAQSVLVRAEAKPSVVMVGETGSYSIRFLNTKSIPNLNTPRVSGLDFRDTPSTSSYQQIINGRVSVETEVSWAFRPTRVGSFTIPSRTVQIGPETIRIPEVEVQAIPMDEETRSRAILLLDLPEGPYYVGQALPARLSLLVRRDLTLSNVAFPESEGDAFIHSEFDNNPSRGTRQVKGRSYSAVVWDLLITPIKSGPAELRFSQNIAIQVVTSDSRFPSIFSMSRSQTEAFSLSSETVSTEILALPEEGKPQGFRDAVGSFEITSKISSSELMVGEPMTLTLTLTGEGNFDRISPPELPEWENWRLYPPKVEFTPSDARGFQGSKSFEFILIPQSESIEEIPEIQYSTFNPRTSLYESTVLAAQAVSVKPSDKPVDTGLPLLSGSAEDQAAPRIPEKILPLRPGYGKLHPVHSVLWKESVFWIYNVALALILMLGLLRQLRKRRLRDNAHLARRHSGSRKVRKALQTAQAAAKAGDASAFLKSARFAVQESVCHLSKKPLEANTLVSSDCIEILESNNVPDSIKSTIEDILHAADAHQFASVTLPSGRLEDLRAGLISAISDLNRIIK